MEKTSLSLVIITMNNEKVIERCIRSVPFVSDIVVLDGGSQDRTVDIVKRLGARIRVEHFRGYQKAKIRATAMALHDWVLALDPDESLSPELEKEIEELLEKDLEPGAYDMPRLSNYLGKWIKHGGWYPDRQTRLFHKEKGEWTEDHVYGSFKADKVSRLKNSIHRWPFKDLSDHVETNNTYTSVGAKEIIEAGRDFSFLKMIFAAKFKFIGSYFFKKGFLDGIPGIIIAATAAYSAFLTHAKVWELKKSQNDK